MNRTDKETLVQELQEHLQQAPTVIVASSSTMSVNASNAMRTQFRNAGIHYRVVKNTLAKLAMTGTPLEGLFSHLKGPTALAYHLEDPVVAAKTLAEFAKGNDKLQLRAGSLYGQVMDAGGLDALSKLPGRDEMRAMLLGTMNAVGGQFVRVLAAGPQSMLQVLQARRDSLGGA